MIPCIWYVSSATRPWERLLIGNMASALRGRGVSLSLYVDGGTTGINVTGIHSWRALTGFERMKRVLLSRRALWHLWGEAPFWWGLVRLRFRTVHTSFDAAPSWLGHPSRIFPEPSRNGESIILPTFDSRVSQMEEEQGQAVYMDPAAASPALRWVLDDLGAPVIDLREVRFNSVPARSGVVIPGGPEPSDALLATVMTMHGLTVAALDSPYLQALLGPDGYFVAEDTADVWRDTLIEALSDRGRALGASARHFVNTRCSASACADSIVSLYTRVLES